MWTIGIIPWSDMDVFPYNDELHKIMRQVFIEKFWSDNGFLETLDVIRESEGYFILQLNTHKQVVGVLSFEVIDKPGVTQCVEQFLYILSEYRKHVKVLPGLINAFGEYALSLKGAPDKKVECYIGSSLANPEKYAKLLKHFGYTVCSVQLKKEV